MAARARSSGCRRTPTGARCEYRTAGFGYDEQHDHWDMPRGAAPVAARVRPGAAARALPGEGAHLQRVPAQGRMHRLRSRPRGGAAARPVAALRGRALPPRAVADAGRARGARTRRRRRAQPRSGRGCALLVGLLVARGARWHAGSLRDFRAHPAGFPARAGPRARAWWRRAPRGAVRAAAGHRRTATEEDPDGRTRGCCWRSWLHRAVERARVVREYERAVVFRLGRLLPVKGPGPRASDAAGRPDGAGRSADGHDDDPAAGGDHARQRAGARGGRLLLPRRWTRARRSPRSRRSRRPRRRSRRPRSGRCWGGPTSTSSWPSASG